MMTTEMGEAFRSAVEEAVKCAWAYADFMPKMARAFLADEVVITPATRSYVRCTSRSAWCSP